MFGMTISPFSFTGFITQQDALFYQVNRTFTENAAFCLTDSYLNLLNKNACWRNFCDLAKSFDCINHEILLAKLHFYETQGDVFFMRIDDLSYCFVNCL